MKHLRKDYDRIQDPAVDNPELLSEGSTPIGETEPVFLIRGKDRAGSAAVRAWADEAERIGASREVVESARKWAHHMDFWRSRNEGGQVPDCPSSELIPNVK